MRAAAVVRTRPVRRTGVADDEQCSAGCDRCSRAAQNRPTRNLDLRVQEARGDEVEGRQRLPLGEVGRDPGDLVAGLPGSRPRWPVPSGRCRRPSQSIRYGRARAHRPLHRSRGRERCPVECRRPRVRGRRSPCRSRTCRSPGSDSPQYSATLIVMVPVWAPRRQGENRLAGAAKYETHEEGEESDHRR